MADRETICGVGKVKQKPLVVGIVVKHGNFGAVGEENGQRSVGAGVGGAGGRCDRSECVEVAKMVGAIVESDHVVC